MVVDLRMLGDQVLTRQKLTEALAELDRQKPLNVVSEDAYGCCGAIRKALVKDPFMEAWTCPKCGMDWKPRMIDGIRMWEARPAFLMWKRR